MKKVSKRLQKVARKNGCKDRDIAAMQDLMDNGWNETEAYAVTHPKATRETARGNASNFFKRPKIQKTLQEILEKKGITKESVMDKHVLIRDLAIDQGQLGVAAATNKDFFPIVGIGEEKKSNNNIFLVEGRLNLDMIDKKLGLAKGEIIEGEAI